MLSEIGLFTEKFNLKLSKIPNQFECYSTFMKAPNDILKSDIENYKLVKKGEVIGHNNLNIEIVAPEDFYPVLFGETNYKTIFGFMAKKLT